MALTMILTGDVNLMKVADPSVPFRRVGEELRKADVVFGNLECCLTVPATHSHGNEGFFADPVVGGEALRLSGLQAVGIANNVHYGDANIMASIARLDALAIPHTGAGKDLASARAPVILERAGVRFGFLQRSSVYWPTNHEAHADAAGIAVIRGHTAYQVPAFKTRPEVPPPNRPGVPPEIVTWADAARLRGRRRGASPARRHPGGVVPLGAAQGSARLHERDRACGDRRRRRHRDGARSALFAAGRHAQGQGDLLRARQPVVRHRPRRTQAWRLARHAGARRRRPQRHRGRTLPLR